MLNFDGLNFGQEVRGFWAQKTSVFRPKCTGCAPENSQVLSPKMRPKMRRFGARKCDKITLLISQRFHLNI